MFSIFLNKKVRCLFLLDSPQRGNSNEYTQHTITIIQRKIIKIIQNTIVAAAMEIRTSSK